MLTALTIRNFKCIAEVRLDLGPCVVLVGPNSSGKTAVLQALGLWRLGVRRCIGLSEHVSDPVTINRHDLVAIPVPHASLLWRDLQVRNCRIEVVVEGLSSDGQWTCGLEFEYANPESLYCRPLQSGTIPMAATAEQVVLLPPLSGLTSNEPRLDPGAINVRLGEGRTTDVLRNICYRLSTEKPEAWTRLAAEMRILFGCDLRMPEYSIARGELLMSYSERGGGVLDLSCAGRGMQQTLLLLAYLALNPNSTILLDEPDAHLEILRQRQIYNLVTSMAARNNCQLIAASHSEVILNEAAGRDVVIAFVGKPHRIDDRGSQLVKSLRDIGFDHYYQAEQTGWVLYVEGSSDLAILREFARILGHEAAEHLEQPFVHFVGNQPRKAEEHFHGLREAKSDLTGFALFDRLDRTLPAPFPALPMHQWSRREVENYLCSPEAILGWTREFSASKGPVEAMELTIAQISDALEKLGKDPWSRDTKVTDDFLDPLFRRFFQSIGMPALFQKSQYHVLARFVPRDQIDPEVVQVLDGIVRVARRARQNH